MLSMQGGLAACVGGTVQQGAQIEAAGVECSTLLALKSGNRQSTLLGTLEYVFETRIMFLNGTPKVL